jgi:hypothetical protein
MALLKPAERKPVISRAVITLLSGAIAWRDDPATVAPLPDRAR